MRVLGAIVIACGALAACVSKSSPSSPSSQDVTACKACVLDGNGWCPRSGQCEDILTNTCGLDLVTDRPACGPSQADQDTALPIDCRGEGITDPRCGTFDTPPNTIGKGINIDPLSLAGGFIDTANNRLVVAFACDACIHSQTGVLGIDLSTGDRALLSGHVEDPLTGNKDVGTGDAASSLDDVQLAPNGKWWALDNNFSGAEIFEIDPATGNRTLLYAQDQFDPDTTPCKVAGYGLTVGWDVPTVSASGLANLIIHPDGEIFLRAERAGTPTEDLGLEAIVALENGQCRVVTAWSYNRPDILVGDGPSIVLNYVWLIDHGDSLLASESPYFLHSIDVATGNRTMVSSASAGAPVGGGPQLSEDFAGISADGTTLFTTGGSYDAGDGFIGVDLATGERDAYPPLGGPLENAFHGPVYPHPTLPGVYIEPMDSMVILFEPASGNSMFLSR